MLFKEMYEDQPGVFIWACLDQKHKLVIRVGEVNGIVERQGTTIL